MKRHCVVSVGKRENCMSFSLKYVDRRIACGRGKDAAMFLRRTESYVVALQQLGRCLKAGSDRHR
ncbi:MAG: hypothetical protein ACLVEJ_11160 [Parabacteroides sp.]